MTVIFANNHDIDCETLPKIWEGQPNVNLIEIDKHSIDWEDKVDPHLRWSWHLEWIAVPRHREGNIHLARE